MGYNQHQSFYLRDRWLSKALKSIEDNPQFFFEKDAFEKIGLGKNMVQSLRHWVKATRVIDESTKNKIHTYTDLGIEIMKNDIMVKYVGTAALLHYSIVSKDEPSTAWYWFFNIYGETMATKEDIYDEFRKWVQRRETRVVSENSLKRDVECLVKMYTSGGDSRDPEEVTLSPLYKLGLLKEQNGVVYKKEAVIPENQRSFLLYILINYCVEYGQFEISLEDILVKEGLLGKVFNLSRSTIVKLLTEFTHHPRYPITFTRTNNLDMLLIPNIDPKLFLEQEYSRKAADD